MKKLSIVKRAAAAAVIVLLAAGQAMHPMAAAADDALISGQTEEEPQTGEELQAEAEEGQERSYAGGPEDLQAEEIEEDALADPDTLFAEYVQQQLYGVRRRRLLASASRKLSGLSLYVYGAMRSEISAIANGTLDSSRITIPIGDYLSECEQTVFTAEDLGLAQEELVEDGAVTSAAKAAVYSKMGWNHKLVVTALLADSPYEFYWYDKTASFLYGNFSVGYKKYASGEIRITVSDKTGDADNSVTLYLPVAKAYAADPSVYDEDLAEYGVSMYTKLDTEKTKAASVAAQNARAIVDESADLPDLARLEYYRSEICDAVEYDYEALENDTPYGDPWQIISVFDGNDATNVVCEGYSKAFQYLCDLTNFRSDIRCLSATGEMHGGTGAGSKHMWNVVQMPDGENYLADLTNCDSGTIGAPAKLFLAGADSYDRTYTFKFLNSRITYEFDSDSTAVYGAEDLFFADHAAHQNHLCTGEPRLIWNEDGTACEVEYECGLCGEKVREACTITSAVTREPGCYEDGEETVTASFSVRIRDRGQNSWTAGDEPVYTEQVYEGTSAAALAAHHRDEAADGQCDVCGRAVRHLTLRAVSADEDGIVLSGAGIYGLADDGAPEKTAQVEAPDVEGSRFAGWFDEDGSLVGSSGTLSLDVLEDRTLLALYEPVRTVTVQIAGKCTAYTAEADAEPAETAIEKEGSVSCAEGAAVTLRYSGGEAFAGWYTDEGELLSSGEEYVFTAVRSLRITARTGAQGQDLRRVFFLNGAGQIISSQDCSPSSMPVYPDVPVREGYDAAGWSIDEAAMRALLSEGGGAPVTVEPVYAPREDMYTITAAALTPGGLSDVTRQYAAGPRTEAVLDADALAEEGGISGRGFDGWYVTDAEGKEVLLATRKEAALSCGSALRVTARFGETGGEDIPQVPVSALTECHAGSGSGADRAVLWYNSDVPEGYEVLEIGVRFCTDTEYSCAGDALAALVQDDSPFGAMRMNAPGSRNMLIAKLIPEGGTVWSIGYITARDGSGRIRTWYSGMHAYTPA